MKMFTILGSLIALLAISMIVLVFILFPVPQFPEPTGPYHIGTRIYEWIDDSRPEPFTNDPNDVRELIVQVWYPTNDPPLDTFVPYLEHHEVSDALATRLHMPAFLLRNVQKAPTHAIQNALPAPARFPLLLNPTGLSGYRDASLFWIEALVSHGYVVVGIDQPGTAAATVFADGRVVPVIDDIDWFDHYMPLALSHTEHQTPAMNGVPLPGGIIPFLAGDLRFVLDQLAIVDQQDTLLKNHLDLAHTGVFGMSLGGYVGPETCRQDPRLLACLVADAGQTAAVAQYGLEQAVLIMSRDDKIMRQERASAGGWPEPEIVHTINDQRALFDHSRGDAYYLTMNQMYHINWTDVPLWSPAISWLGLAGPIDPYRGYAATNAYTVAFFDRYLKGQPAPLLEGPSIDWPDVQFESHH